ncbi:MAG: hypothetical protein LQ350_007571 [Teloschistes chrysophthalmus]|nr:MAG: hypothetical protein LQ350_007571 [Niorma chrysophthalma]
MDHHAEIDEQYDASDSGSRDAIVVPQMNDLKIDTATEADDHPDDCDKESIASEDSDDSVMEPFDDYKPKIQCLLNNIGLPEYEAEVIQHGYQYQNCVYALKSPRATEEQYVLRVAIGDTTREEDGRDESIENEVALLNYLDGKLPVPHCFANLKPSLFPLPVNLSPLRDGYLNDDQFADNVPIADEAQVLKTYFDREMETAVPGYLEDAYGWGRWLRRIWYFAKKGAYRQYEWKFLDRLIEEWGERKGERGFGGGEEYSLHSGNETVA